MFEPDLMQTPETMLPDPASYVAMGSPAMLPTTPGVVSRQAVGLPLPSALAGLVNEIADVEMTAATAMTAAVATRSFLIPDITCLPGHWATLATGTPKRHHTARRGNRGAM
ncbi:MAG: hypothetical protein AB7U23_05340 [Dehalococcoidia bacterium]